MWRRDTRKQKSTPTAPVEKLLETINLINHLDIEMFFK